MIAGEVLASGAAVAAASGQRRGPCRRRLPGRIPRLVRVRVRTRVRVRVYRVRDSEGAPSHDLAPLVEASLLCELVYPDQG